jgi:hypothetical protein
MKINRLPTSGKDYEYDGGKGTHISNLPVRENIRSARTGVMELFDDNRKVFPKVLGEKPARWTGSVRWDVWKIAITPETQMFLLTSKNGSSIEVCGEYEKDEKEITKFLLKLIPELKKTREKLVGPEM